jgi:hypothetical protein
MTFYEAAVEVLRQVGRPLHYKKITELAVRRCLLSHVGKTPEMSMANRLEQAVRKDKGDAAVVRTRPGVFALRVWGSGKMPLVHVAETAGTDSGVGLAGVAVGPDGVVARGGAGLAERVFEVLETAGREPMEPADVARILFGPEDTLLRSSDPETAVRAALLVDDAQRLHAGRPPRFEWGADGRVGLRLWQAAIEQDAVAELEAACTRLSDATREILAERLLHLPASAFEQLLLAVVRESGWQRLGLRARQLDGSVVVVGDCNGRRLAALLLSRGRALSAGDVESHREFMGRSGADVGWMMSYAEVPEPVAAFARTVDLRVTDRAGLIDRFVALGLGVREVTVRAQVIHEAFLRDLEGTDERSS